MNDLVNEAVLLHYKKEKKKQKNNLYKKVLKNHFENEYYYNRSSVANAFKRLKYNQDKIAEQFYEMLSKDDVNLSKYVVLNKSIWYNIYWKTNSNLPIIIFWTKVVTFLKYVTM